MSYTRDWDESVPTNDNYGYDIDNYIRQLREDVAERLSSMVYGFVNGETSLEDSIKDLNFYVQTTPATPTASYGKVYAKTASGKAELHWLDQDGDEVQLTDGGKINYAAITVTADSITQAMIQLDNNSSLIGRNAADDGDVELIKANASDEAELPTKTIVADTSEMASSAAPTTDAGISNKKYVDDSVAAIAVGTPVTGSLVSGTVYQASGDGMLTVWASGGGFTVYSDAATPPTDVADKDTVSANDYSGVRNCHVLIPANHYVEVDANVSYRWVPFGSGTLT